MIVERVEKRVLGAVRLVNAVNGLSITRPVSFFGDGLSLTRNVHGDYVILNAPTLWEHTRTFEGPPSTPTMKSVKIPVSIHDPAGEFLPQKFLLELPRDPEPEKPDSIFEPILMPLYLSPTARSEISWVVLNAT